MATASSSSLEGDLAAWGKVITLRTRGRSSGRTRSASVGFIAEHGDEGPLLIAASDDDADWARNLLARADCEVTRGSETRPYRAVLLTAAERQPTVAALILKYGTPAERLGGGPAFRLLPQGAGRAPQTRS